MAVDHEADNLTEEERAVVSSDRSSCPRKKWVSVYTLYTRQTSKRSTLDDVHMQYSHTLTVHGAVFYSLLRRMSKCLLR